MPASEPIYAPRVRVLVWVRVMGVRMLVGLAGRAVKARLRASGGCLQATGSGCSSESAVFKFGGISLGVGHPNTGHINT